MNALIETERLADGREIHIVRGRKRRPVALTVHKAGPQSAARDAALVYAESRLSPWAKWAKDNRSALGFPTISLLYQAMQSLKVGMCRGTVYPVANVHGEVEYPINADGRATRSYRPAGIGEVPEAIVEVDEAVAAVPHKPRQVLIADYFTYGPIEVRCKQTPYKRARYLQLLESAKYSVYVALASRRS